MGFFTRMNKGSKGNSILTTSQSSTSSTASKPKNKRTSSGGIISTGPRSHTFSTKTPKMDMPRPPDPTLDAAGYLRSLGAVRERSKIIMDKTLENQLTHFDVEMNKMQEIVSFVSSLIKRDYEAPFTSIPGHGRYQHFGIGGKDRIAELLASWPATIDNKERCRRMIDLFLVSVLLDAGAGTEWGYTSKDNDKVYRRSEGLAVASLDMFKEGLFSGDPSNKLQVDAAGLKALTPEKLATGLQSRPGNELAGIEGRTDLLIRLSGALREKAEFFGPSARPGGMVDYLLSHPSTHQSPITVALPVLWNVLMNGLAPIWPPSRTSMDGVSLGDAWPCTTMPKSAKWETILPFHKLTQWLTYSLMQPMQSLLNIHFAGTELLTGLPEYRNGGLFVDFGLLSLKKDDAERGMENYSDWCRRKGIKGVERAPMFEPSDDVIVEWRGATVGLLDLLCVEVNKALKHELAGHDLSLPQLLEAGSWKGGREIAEINRPNTKEPPILIESDGTVF